MYLCLLHLSKSVNKRVLWFMFAVRLAYTWRTYMYRILQTVHRTLYTLHRRIDTPSYYWKVDNVPIAVAVYRVWKEWGRSPGEKKAYEVRERAQALRCWTVDLNLTLSNANRKAKKVAKKPKGSANLPNRRAFVHKHFLTDPNHCRLVSLQPSRKSLLRPGSKVLT